MSAVNDSDDDMNGDGDDDGDSGVSLRKCLKAFKHPRVEVDGFLYHFHKQCNQHLRWKCNRVFSMKCPSILRTTKDVNDLTLVAVDHDHIHPNDSKAILHVKNRYANMKEKSRVDPTKQSTMVKLKETGVFDQRNGKRLYPYITEDTINEYRENSRSDIVNGIECVNIEEMTLLDSRNNINQNDQNEIETNSHVNFNSNKINNGEVIEQNMYHSTSHDHIETHSQINTTIFETNNHNMIQLASDSECSYFKNKSNEKNESSIQLIEISDDDDDDNYNYNYEPVSKDVRLKPVPLSDKNWSNMNEKKNSLIGIEDENRLEVTHPCQNNVLASIDLTSNQESVILQNVESVLQKQQTPYTCTSDTKKVNNNEKIPQLSVTSFESYAESELEAGGTHITEGIVSISVMNDPNSASSNSNPLNGPILNELLSKSHEIVVSPDLSLKKIYGYNSSEIVTPVKNKKSLPANVVQSSHDFIDLTDDDQAYDLKIGNTFTLEPVPAAIPISECVQNNLQKEPETHNIVDINRTRSLPPIPKLKAFILHNWFYKRFSPNAELTLYFDKRAQQNFIKSCELYCYQIDRNASSSTWEYAGEIVSDCFPVILSMRLDNIGRKDIFFSARAADIFGKFGEFCEPVECTYKRNKNYM